MPNYPSHLSWQSYKNANGVHSYNQSKCFYISNSRLMSITLNNKFGLLFVNGSIRVQLYLIDPFNSNSIFVIWVVNQLPCLVVFDVYLLLHTMVPFLKAGRFSYNNITSMINL